MFSQMIEYIVDIETDGSGNAIELAGSSVNGIVHAIKYSPADLEATTSLAITGETTGVPILSETNVGTSDVWYHPLSDSLVPIHAFMEGIKIVVAGGGDTKTGTLTFYVYE